MLAVRLPLRGKIYTATVLYFLRETMQPEIFDFVVKFVSKKELKNVKLTWKWKYLLQ